MPGAGQTTVRGQDAIYQRRTVMRALWTESLDLSACIDEQDFCVETLDVNFLFVAGFQIERGDAGEFVFLCHGSWLGGTEITKLMLVYSFDRRWADRVFNDEPCSSEEGIGIDPESDRMHQVHDVEAGVTGDIEADLGDVDHINGYERRRGWLGDLGQYDSAQRATKR